MHHLGWRSIWVDAEKIMYWYWIGKDLLFFFDICWKPKHLCLCILLIHLLRFSQFPGHEFHVNFQHLRSPSGSIDFRTAWIADVKSWGLPSNCLKSESVRCVVSQSHPWKITPCIAECFKDGVWWWNSSQGQVFPFQIRCYFVFSGSRQWGNWNKSVMAYDLLLPKEDKSKSGSLSHWCIPLYFPSIFIGIINSLRNSPVGFEAKRLIYTLRPSRSQKHPLPWRFWRRLCRQRHGGDRCPRRLGSDFWPSQVGMMQMWKLTRNNWRWYRIASRISSYFVVEIVGWTSRCSWVGMDAAFLRPQVATPSRRWIALVQPIGCLGFVEVLLEVAGSLELELWRLKH